MNPYIQYMYSYPHKTAYRPLKGIRLEDYIHFLKDGRSGLYVHLPFCRSKCGYCNLFSVTGRTEEQISRYLEALRRQSRQYRELLSAQGTIFSELVLGGGTPLLLTAGQLAETFEMLEQYFAFSPDRELVIETSPGETRREKLAVLKQAGVTRISMGIQSFSDEELKTLRRRHSAKKAEEALELIRAYAFPCVNVDFIYGIPGQTVKSLLTSLKEALTFEPEELFLYPLYIKHGAALQSVWQEGQVLRPEDALLQYREASAYLCAHGYRQDSMRRFVRGRNRRVYSECGLGTSLALGCGGRSYLGNLHFCSPYQITREACLAELEHFEQTEDFLEVSHGMLLTEEEQKRRWVIRHLLIRPGLFLPGYRERFHADAAEDFPVLKRWEEQGYVYMEKAYLTLTKRGLELSDYLGPQLISGMVRGKMEEWEHLYGETGSAVSGKSEKL